MQDEDCSARLFGRRQVSLPLSVFCFEFDHTTLWSHLDVSSRELSRRAVIKCLVIEKDSGMWRRALLTCRRMPLWLIPGVWAFVVLSCWLSSLSGNTMFHQAMFSDCCTCSGGWLTSLYGLEPDAYGNPWSQCPEANSTDKELTEPRGAEDFS